MALSYRLNSKKVQIPWQAIVRPMLVASLALHTLVLLFPFPSDKPATKPTEPKEEKINLTQLPPAAKLPTPKAPPAPPKLNVPAPPRLNIPRSANRPTLPALIRPSPIASPVANPAPQPAQPAAPAQPEAPAARPSSDPFATEFPRYPGAQPGSFGLPAAFEPFSQKTTDAMDKVSRWFESQLQGKGYLAQPVSQSSRLVYQVEKAGKTMFLTLIPNAQGAGTNILVSPQLLPEDLGGGNVVSPEEAAFYQSLSEIIGDASQGNSWQDIDNPSILPDPTAFFAKVVSRAEYLQGSVSEPQPGVERKVLYIGQSPDALLADLQNMMQNADLQMVPQGDYGGGKLYQVNRDGVSRFISLVGTNDGNTAIFIWTRSPK